MNAIFVIRIEFRNGWDCIRVPGQEFEWRKNRSEEEEEGKPSQDESGKGQKRTCATMQLYKGKTSVQTDTRYKEAQRRKEEEEWTADDHHATGGGIMNRDRAQRMSAEAISSKGVFRFAPGPRGSGIQEIAETSKGKGKQKVTRTDTVTQEKFEQGILDVSG